MNSIAAVAIAAEPVAPAVTTVHARQRRGAETGEKSDDFASALAGEMRAGGEDGSAATARAAPGDARPTDEDDGDDAPPGGNGLPPWLPGMSEAMLPERPTDAARVALEDAGLRAISRTATDAVATEPPSPTPPVAADASATAAIPEPTLDGAARPATAAVPATDVAEPDTAGLDAADVLREKALPNGRTLPTQAHADGPAPASTARANANRFAGTPAEATHGLPPQAGETARAAAVGEGHGPAVVELPTLPNDRRAPRASLLEPAFTATTAEPVEPPVAPLLRRAVAAALATNGETGPESASIPTAPDSRASLAAAVGATASATNAATAPSLPPLPVAVGAPEWDRHLSERVAVLVDQGLTNAQLKLSPAHLGPLEIRISVQSDQANVWFGTHSHATREALEAAAPRLRDMLGAQGFANVGVSVDLQQQAWRGPDGNGAPTRRHEPEFSFAAGAEVTARSAGASAAAPRVGRSRLDAFA